MEMHLFTAMPIGKTDDGRLIISEKFVEGVQEYQKHWPGTIVVHANFAKGQSNYMDGQILDPAKMQFLIDPTPFDSLQLADKLRNASLIVSALEYNLNHLWKVADKLNIPIIYITEYSYKTQKQILYSEDVNFLVRWRRLYWLSEVNRKNIEAVEQAEGLQCNGTPTYKAYENLNPNTLLYFDSRVREAMVAKEEDIKLKSTKFNDNKRPLRLAFSGRLIAIKGVDYLVPVAIELKRLGVDFLMDICGEGALKDQIAEEIVENGLQDQVKLRGYLNFTKELLPLMRNEIDLFVCPHVQGDPSCTYLEVMSCGVPIVGYNNEAFQGVVEYSHVGWLTPMGDENAMAAKIQELSRNPKTIAHAAHKSLEFAKKHTFEKTFKTRVDQFLKTLSL